jgi:branched-chain amino acid transport system ATP-binding protein
LAPAVSPVSTLADDRPLLLEVSDVRAGFGVTTVLHGLSLQVHPGEIVGIFGLNGAGKSVSMKVLAGVVPVWSGRITFDGADITSMPAEQRVAGGMGHVPQGRQVFPALTVEENLRLGAYTMRRTRRDRYQGALSAVFDQFPLLAERRNQAAGTLSGGQQASLAVARALINEPRLVLVDEPSAGLSPVAVRELFTTLKSVAATGVTMVLVEQNVAFGLQLADRANILQNGRIVYAGDVGTLDQDALARYLGIGRMLGATTGAALTGRRSPAPKATTTTRARRAARSGG